MATEVELKRLLVDMADEAGPLDARRDRVVARVRRRRRVRTGAVGLAVLCLAGGGALTMQDVGGAAARPVAGESPRPGPSARICNDVPPPVPKPGTFSFGDTRSCQYIGLTLEAARELAAKEHRDLQIASRDGVNYGITYEFRTSRVVVTLIHDHVTTALIG
ncbi:hypothetical protein [Streptomyces virginiae]|uniref:PepSY domain-containing protein n=1 Tax=Streptomyces virginiae TaxID=1961 RepID=A0ABZ1T4X6_STRVG|nr:hypothetical protein [Streptomyces virginiae]